MNAQILIGATVLLILCWILSDEPIKGRPKKSRYSPEDLLSQLEEPQTEKP